MRAILVQATAALILLTAACKTAPEAPPEADPAVTAGRLDVTEQTLSSFGATAWGTVSNPRATDLVLEQVTYRFSARGEEVREGRHDLAITVPAEGEAEVSVPVAVEWALSAEEIAALSGTDAVPLVFNGVVKGRYGSRTVEFAFDRAGRLRRPRLPEVALDQPDGSRRKIDEVYAIVRLQVQNDNNFDVRISGLDYVLEFEGTALREGTAGTGHRLLPSGAYVIEIEQEITPERVENMVEEMRARNALSYRVHGTLRIGDVAIPFDLQDQMTFHAER
jgi:LEA14-like dessication related protein